jgi:hypothetical protein
VVDLSETLNALLNDIKSSLAEAAAGRAELRAKMNKDRAELFANMEEIVAEIGAVRRAIAGLCPVQWIVSFDTLGDAEGVSRTGTLLE